MSNTRSSCRRETSGIPAVSLTALRGELILKIRLKLPHHVVDDNGQFELQQKMAECIENGKAAGAGEQLAI